MSPSIAKTEQVDTTRTLDHLGRPWSHDKLDRLLEDPEIAAVVDEMAAAWCDADGNYSLVRARTWAHGRRRSEAELALLIMLWARRLPARYGRSA